MVFQATQFKFLIKLLQLKIQNISLISVYKNRVRVKLT